MNVVITGAGRGIGLGFVRHYFDQGAQVWAVCRKLSEDLRALQQSGVRVVYWDVRHESPDPGGDSLPDSIDLLINNAGIYGAVQSGAPDNNQALDAITMDEMQQVFDVDCLGALRVVQYVLPAIKSGAGVVANLSSKMGSSADNSSGGCYAYRAAKAALVIVSKSMAIDLRDFGVNVITLHPGWVKTDMTGFNGLITIEQSIAGMTDVITRVKEYEAGQFVAFDGAVIPY